MPFKPTDFAGLLIFEPTVFNDPRGIFFESYNEDVFKKNGISSHFVQDNQSSSAYGVIRGLHYQLKPHAQGKLVRVLNGRILDVVVDIRRGSPTFGKTFSIELSSENRFQLYIPHGFAHGFSVLSTTADVFYKCDEFYNKQSEGGIHHSDSTLGIDWKIPARDRIVSDKDNNLPLFADCMNNFVFNERQT